MAFPLAFGFFFPFGFSPLEYTLSFLSPFRAEVGCLARGRTGQGQGGFENQKRAKPPGFCHCTFNWGVGERISTPFFDLSHSVPQIRPTPFPKP